MTRKSKWWTISFEDGLLTEASLCKWTDESAITEEGRIPAESSTCFFSIPGTKIEESFDHDIPHTTFTKIDDPSGRMWIVVESTNLLDACIKASGLLAQKKGKTS